MRERERGERRVVRLCHGKSRPRGVRSSCERDCRLLGGWDLAGGEASRRFVEIPGFGCLVGKGTHLSRPGRATDGWTDSNWELGAHQFSY